MSLRRSRLRLAVLAVLGTLLVPGAARGADHNDPNAINSIFADVAVSAADLYDIFGFPGEGAGGEETVVVALTFASVPRAGVFDTDLLYRILVDPDRRVERRFWDDWSLDSVLAYAGAVKDRYANARPAEVRVRFDRPDRARVSFLGFPGGDYWKVVPTDRVVRLRAGGHEVKLFVGGRDDAFFNDLPGFFRSINYAPQFYRVPEARVADRELEIPKTLLELEGNKLFNFDPANPRHGQGVKEELPEGPLAWNGRRFAKDADGNYRFVYSGRDAQAGMNVNTVIVELPLALLTTSPETERVVSAWGESWVLKAADKIESIADEHPHFGDGFRAWIRRPFAKPPTAPEAELARYKLVDTDGVPFSDAALSERANDRQVGANNVRLARHYVIRYGHLGWGFGPSVSALGLGTCFDHDEAPVSIHRTYRFATTAFPRVAECLFQEINMPDDSWKTGGVDVPLKRPVEVFIPNVTAIDMDTNGSWPYGRRLEDQVATRFLSLFLDMDTGCGGGPCHLESLNDPELWQGVPIEPKTPPNPLANDKEFLDRFPYLAEPW